MSSIDKSKRLNDDELEAVAGGMTPLDPMLLNAMGHGFPGLNLNATAADIHAAAAPPTIDASAVAGLMHSTVSSAVAGGGAYVVDTHTPVHTDSPPPLVMEQTHTMAPAHASVGSSSVPPSQNEPIAISGQVTIVGNLNDLNINVPSDANSHATVEVMDLSKTPSTWTRVDPNVTAMDSGGGAPNTANPYTVAYNTNFKPPN